MKLASPAGSVAGGPTGLEPSYQDTPPAPAPAPAPPAPGPAPAPAPAPVPAAVDYRLARSDTRVAKVTSTGLQVRLACVVQNANVCAGTLRLESQVRTKAGRTYAFWTQVRYSIRPGTANRRWVTLSLPATARTALKDTEPAAIRGILTARTTQGDGRVRTWRRTGAIDLRY